LWHNPRVKPTIIPPGSRYDINFTGGWDEQFPSDQPCRHQGKSYPDHGELWTQKAEWDIQQSNNALTLYTRIETPITNCRMERWITITADSTVIRFRHRLTNLTPNSFDYIWKFHPAFSVNQSQEILIPAGAGFIAEPGSGRLSADRPEFTWPHVPANDGSTIDLSKTPVNTGKIEFRAPGYEMVYLTELYDGWYAVIDRTTDSAFGLAFDKELFDNLWIFQTFGGWQDVQVLVIEPSTGYPYNLAKAASSGRVAKLKPNQVLETQTTAVIFTDRHKIEHIGLDGKIE
ncbi:MAG: aldose epimerase family protein, partial [Planctomycetota bacterium]